MNQASAAPALLAVLAFSICLPATGCYQQDANLLAKLGRKLAQKTETLATGSNDRLLRGWQAMPLPFGETATDVRVSARLHWDKALTGAAIRVQLVDGAIELTGKVRTADQKQVAVALAQATVGVDRVLDRLEIEADAPSTSAH